MAYMKRSLLLITFLFICTPFLFAFGKQIGHKQKVKKADKKTHAYIIKDPVLKRLIKKNRALFAVYDTLSVFGQDYDLHKFHLSPKEVSGDNDPDSYIVDGGTLMPYYTSEIYNSLKKILSYKSIYKYNLKKLFGTDINLGISVSPDGKLYCFSYDENTGGTYHSRISIVHYQDSKRILYNSFSEDQSDESNNSIFSSDGYGTIDTIHTKQGVKYLLQGYVVGCSTCMEDYILLANFNQGKFKADFDYSVSNRMTSEGPDGYVEPITFDKKRKTISVDFALDDLTSNCDCTEKKLGSSDNDDTTSNDSTKVKCHCLYKFNGETFVSTN